MDRRDGGEVISGGSAGWFALGFGGGEAEEATGGEVAGEEAGDMTAVIVDCESPAQREWGSAQPESYGKFGEGHPGSISWSTHFAQVAPRTDIQTRYQSVLFLDFCFGILGIKSEVEAANLCRQGENNALSTNVCARCEAVTSRPRLGG